MALQDQRLSGIAPGTVGADHRARLGKIMLDWAEAAQIFQLVDVDMPIVDLIAALSQKIADHVLARSFRAARRGNRDKIPRGRKLCLEIGIHGVEDFLSGIGGIHRVGFPVVAFRIAGAPIHSRPGFGCHGDTDAR
jgi:hypothetical protein